MYLWHDLYLQIVIDVFPCVGFVGAGNYASRILIPTFKEAGAMLDTLVTSGGISGVHHGNKNGFLVTSTKIIQDKTHTFCGFF